jgi:glycerol-1-phosphate dehydrogenase [NAD(P)+]
MNHDRISDALRGAGDTEQVVIGDGALRAVPEVVQRSFGDAPVVVVADETTWAVAGEAVHRGLTAGGRELLTPHVFPARPVLYADYDTVRTLAASLADHSAVPVVIGSGTLNDLAKRACFELQRPYMTVATAASMDGYTAFGAAITKEGYKQTMTCPAPRAVLADLAILTAAPARMTSSGYADLLAKICAGADWIAADVLEVEAIEPRPWSLVQGPLREATGRPAELHGGDPAAMGGLIEGLIMAGLAMQAAGSSRPASGAEHQFSHLWEMEGLGQHPAGDGPPLSHGFKVGLGTVAIAALYERVLARDLAALDVEAAVAAWPAWGEAERRVRAAHTTPGLDEAAVEQSREKYVPAAELRTRLGLLAERWPGLAERLRAQLLGAGELTARLRAAGCPTTPGEIGLTAGRLRSTYRRAQMIRTRFTVLDLADQAGILDACVAELFAPGGFWAGSVRGGSA